MIEILKKRFLENTDRHPDLKWEDAEKRLLADPKTLVIFNKIEEGGGEPDAIGLSDDGESVIYCDCSKESTAGRRSLCYDGEALRKRAKNPPSGSAEEQAEHMGASLLTESLYRRLQSLGEFDLKTSS